MDRRDMMRTVMGNARVVLVCGSRTWTDPEPIRAYLSTLPVGTHVIHGAARGADEIAGRIADSLGLMAIGIPAEWNSYGRRAGPMRNQKMLDTWPVSEVVAFRCEAHSPGTQDMIRRARKKGIPVRTVEA